MTSKLSLSRKTARAINRTTQKKKDRCKSSSISFVNQKRKKKKEIVECSNALIARSQLLSSIYCLLLVADRNKRSTSREIKGDWQSYSSVSHLYASQQNQENFVIYCEANIRFIVIEKREVFICITCAFWYFSNSERLFHSASALYIHVLIIWNTVYFFPIHPAISIFRVKNKILLFIFFFSFCIQAKYIFKMLNTCLSSIKIFVKKKIK